MEKKLQAEMFAINRDVDALIKGEVEYMNLPHYPKILIFEICS